MYLWLRWWMGHYSKRTWFPNCVIVFAVKGMHTCVFICALWISLLFPVREQTGYLATMSQPVLLTDKLHRLSQQMCVRVCESWTALQPFSENYLNLMFALQTDKRRHAVGGNVMCARVCLIAWLSLWGSGCAADFWRARTFWPLS